MDKNAIKKFAVWARTELIARVSLKGVEYGITEDNIEAANADSVGGKVLTADEKKQRQALIAEINDKSYKQVMEEVAYTWFNRFSALRFMEVNGYLPSHVRVFTDEENNFRPQIITEAIHLDLDGLNMEKVYELKDAEKTEELYKYLLIVQCNALNKVLPGMFQKIADYTELLLPDNLLREGSVIQQMIELIPEDDWKDAVQIIGWLYQYYNSEKKDDVFAALKKNVKITKENIPAATQLFTPDWIVRYMVENSLGRLWLEGHPDVKEQLLPTEEEQSAYAAGNRDPEDTKWHYYLEEAEQEPEVQAQLAEIRKEYAALTPDRLKVIDPCSGYRNNQIICDLANQMYPDMKPCDSAMNEKTGHDGIFWVHENDIDKYVDIYNPVQLRYDKRTKVNPIPKTMNFGLSKGLTFNRVLIYPTKPMLDWLSGKSKDMKDESLSKFYVAVTRARYSVAFVYKTKRLPSNDIGTKWTPDVLE